MQSPLTWLIAAVLASTIVAIAWRLRSLSNSGAVAAMAMGTIVVGTGGWRSGVILVAFFATSCIASRVGRQHDHQARGARRDAVQVLANGWSILLGGILFVATGEVAWLLFGVGGLAAATADTWSSEIGRLSTTPPRMITTRRIAPPGSSGAVSALGTVASVAGALLIASLAAVAFGEHPSPMIVFAGIAIGGIAGGVVDSVLGATVQERRFCPSCQLPTESNPHRCGTSTQFAGGVRGLNNDVVNLTCVLTGAIVGLLSGIL